MRLRWSKDLGKPLDSVNGVKYLKIMWSIIGTNPLNSTVKLYWRILYYLYSAVANLLFSVCFPVSVLVYFLFIDSYIDLVQNLSESISIAMSVIKHLVVLKDRQRLLHSHFFLELLDERSNYHSQDRKHILNAIHYSKLYSLYFPFYFFCGCGYLYNGWSHHQFIINAWYPDLFSNSEDNYLAFLIFQSVAVTFIIFQTVFNDIYPLCYLTLMIGHLESLAARISRIGWSKKSEDTNIEELKNCIKDHKNLLGYFDCIRPIIANTLFCQFIIDGLVLCMTAINLTFFISDVNERFFAVVYLIILLIQILPCCWQVNVLMEKSNYLTTAMYSCNWMDQNLKFRKMLIIFMQRSQKTNTISAGNLAPVTLQTFLAIIRLSFSLFTILSKI